MLNARRSLQLIVEGEKSYDTTCASRRLLCYFTVSWLVGWKVGLLVAIRSRFLSYCCCLLEILFNTTQHKTK